MHPHISDICGTPRNRYTYIDVLDNMIKLKKILAILLTVLLISSCTDKELNVIQIGFNEILSEKSVLKNDRNSTYKLEVKGKNKCLDKFNIIY